MANCVCRGAACLQFARVLREDGFDGAVILEPYAQLVESEQALLESIRFLRGVFGAPAQL